MAAIDILPQSGTRVPTPINGNDNGTNVWFPGTYLLYQRGIEYFRPGEEPAWLAGACATSDLAIGGLEAYWDEATDEPVPVLRVTDLRA